MVKYMNRSSIFYLQISLDYMKLAYIVYCTRVYGKYSFFEYKKEKDVIKREQPIKKNKKRKEGSVVRRKLDNKLSNKINR